MACPVLFESMGTHKDPTVSSPHQVCHLELCKSDTSFILKRLTMRLWAVHHSCSTRSANRGSLDDLYCIRIQRASGKKRRITLQGIIPFRNVFVHICVCVWVGIYVGDVYVCAWMWSESSFVWGKVSHWLETLPSGLGSLVSVLQGPTCFCLTSQCW